MLKDALISSSQPPSRRALLKHASSLMISLAAHALLLIPLALFYAPVKILDLGEVRDVYIAPPLDRLYLPVASGDVSGISQSSGVPPREAVLSPPTALPEPASGAGRASLPAQTIPRSLKIPAAITRNFDLQSSSPPADVPSWGSAFQLAPRSRPHIYDYSPPNLRSGPLTAQILPAASIPYGGTDMSGRSGPSRGPGSESTGSAGRQVDISTWADRAAALIMNNWFIPLFTQTEEEDEFEISILVLKDGWIASTEVIRASRIPELQQAALKALELSSPLPRLPRGLSEDRLELRLVFSSR